MKTKIKKVSTKIIKKKSESEPLTLKILNEYTQKVLLPALEKKLVTKKEFSELKTDVAMIKIDSTELKEDVSTLKTEFKDFKDSSLTNQDAILKNLNILLAEKEVVEYQKEKEKKLWIIIINSLKEHRILSSGELEKISKLDVF